MEKWNIMEMRLAIGLVKLRLKIWNLFADCHIVVIIMISDLIKMILYGRARPANRLHKHHRQQLFEFQIIYKHNFIKTE